MLLTGTVAKPTVLLGQPDGWSSNLAEAKVALPTADGPLPWDSAKSPLFRCCKSAHDAGNCRSRDGKKCMETMIHHPTVPFGKCVRIQPSPNMTGRSKCRHQTFTVLDVEKTSEPARVPHDGPN